MWSSLLKVKMEDEGMPDRKLLSVNGVVKSIIRTVMTYGYLAPP